jgi:hypothetical protein
MSAAAVSFIHAPNIDLPIIDRSRGSSTEQHPSIAFNAAAIAPTTLFVIKQSRAGPSTRRNHPNAPSNSSDGHPGR